MDLDWGYECRLNRMCEQVKRQLILVRVDEA